MKLLKFFSPISLFINNLSAKHIFFSSLLCFVFLFFPKTLQFSLLFLLIFFILALLKRQKILVLPQIIISAFMIASSLYTPVGQVLCTIANFPITKDALFLGLKRSSFLCSMVFLSQYAVGKNLKFSGTFGNFIATVFSIFSSLTSENIKFSKQNIIKVIDDRLFEVYEKQKINLFQNNIKSSYKLHQILLPYFTPIVISLIFFLLQNPFV